MPWKIFISLLTLGLVLRGGDDNLLLNGSFEEPLTAQQLPPHWQLHLTKGAQGAVSLSEDWSSEGQRSVHLQKFNDIGSVTLVQSLHLQPNTEYLLTLQGRRQAQTRWHYYSVRCPGTDIYLAGKIPLDQSECPPLRFISHSQKTLYYITLGLWGYEQPDPATVGELWADEIILRKIDSSGKLAGISDYYFQSDELRGTLILPVDWGEMSVAIIAKGKKLSQKNQLFQAGGNAFSLNWQNLPAGEAVFQIEGRDGGEKFSQPIVLMEDYR